MKHRLRDTLHYSQTLRQWLGQLQWAKARATAGPAQRLEMLCEAYSRVGPGVACDSIRAELAPWLDGPRSGIWREEGLGRRRHAAAIKAHGHGFVSRTAMIKAPGADGEKGVLVTYFEYNFQRLLDGITDYKAFTDRYTVVYSTSWSPTSYALLGNLVAETTGPVIVQACNYNQVPALEAFHPRVRCLETLPCDWLLPEYYEPKPFAERDIDILVVANWAPFKRHWAFFNALRHLPENLRIVCVGQPDTSHGLPQLREMLRVLGVRQHIEFLESIPIDQVTGLQCRAKVGAIFSRREGCCVAAAETLMAGAALALIKGACIGPLAYINEDTGLALDDSRIAEGLRTLLERAPRLHPREYAAGRLSCDVSARKLNDLLKREAAAEGRPWTRDIHTPCWRPYPMVKDPAAKAELQPAFDDLHRLHPAVFPDHLQDTSHR